MRDSIYLSPLGFGCAPIMGRISKSQAMKAMSLAFDLGVTHFDVARSYGFGRAESVVGQFIKYRRDKVTITTKFGVVPPILSMQNRAIIPVARTVANLFPQLKAKLKKKSGELLAERNFDVNFARKCLDESLSALSTDYIDIYLIHEPIQNLLKNPDELRMFLDDCVIAGKIRRWGYSLGKAEDYEWAGAFGGDTLQFEGNVEVFPRCRPILSDSRQRIITRPFIGGLANNQKLKSVFQEIGLTQSLQDMGATLGDVSLSLAQYIAGMKGTVVCSMFTSKHIEENVRSLNKFSGDIDMRHIIDAIVHLLQSDMDIKKVEFK